MDNIASLFSWIFFGDFGLLTLTPRYLFLVLFPIMVLLGVFGQLAPRIPLPRKTGPFANQLFYGFIGLGCTTAALASLDYLREPSMRSRMIWILVLLVPCSSQLAVIATFAAMVTLRVFLTYLLFCAVFIGILYYFIAKIWPLNKSMIKPETAEDGFNLFLVVKTAFRSVIETAPPYCAGSVLISIAMYFGLLDWFCSVFGPFTDYFLHLPPEAAGLFILNILKRDFGSASLLSIAGGGAFDGIQLVILLLMMTFSVPCFNSTILLIKQQKLPRACFIWLGSLLFSVLIGKIAGTVLLVCLI